MAKGDRPRPTDMKVYRENYAKIDWGLGSKATKSLIKKKYKKVKDAKD